MLLLGSQGFAAKIWGVSGTEYMQLADPWPLNPKGELLLSLKIEDKYALANAEKVAAIPGIGAQSAVPAAGSLRASVVWQGAGAAAVGAGAPR